MAVLWDRRTVREQILLLDNNLLKEFWDLVKKIKIVYNYTLTQSLLCGINLKGDFHILPSITKERGNYYVIRII